jgi:hypothetical protein
MALGSFVAGRYSGSWTPPGGQAGDIGIQEKGYNLSIVTAKELITDTDQFAKIVVDAVYQGMNLFIQCKSKEWKSSVLRAALPYGQWLATGANIFGPGVIARLDSNIAGTLVFSSTAGTPAALAPASITATFSLIAEDWNTEFMLAPEHRQIPMRFRIYPYDLGDQNHTIAFLTTT